MDIRKLTRNPGWWRLFIVFAGLWYGAWLIGGIVTISEKLLEDDPWPGTPIPTLRLIDEPEISAYPDGYTDQALTDGLMKAHAAEDTEAAKAIAKMIQSKRDGTRPFKLPEGFILDSDLAVLKEYVNPFVDLIPPPAPWYKQIKGEHLIFAALIIMFPWLVFFGFRLMRYVIEGFVPKQAG